MNTTQDHHRPVEISPLSLSLPTDKRPRVAKGLHAAETVFQELWRVLDSATPERSIPAWSGLAEHSEYFGAYRRKVVTMLAGPDRASPALSTALCMLMLVASEDTHIGVVSLKLPEHQLLLKVLEWQARIDVGSAVAVRDDENKLVELAGVAIEILNQFEGRLSFVEGIATSFGPLSVLEGIGRALDAGCTSVYVDHADLRLALWTSMEVMGFIRALGQLAERYEAAIILGGCSGKHAEVCSHAGADVCWLEYRADPAIDFGRQQVTVQWFGLPETLVSISADKLLSAG